MKWGILNLSPVARKVWWEQVKRVSLANTPCSSRARYEEDWERTNFFPIFTLRNPRGSSSGSTGMGWRKRGMRENALKSLLAGYTLRHCVVWARSKCIIGSEYSIVFCSCYSRSILTSFSSNCLLSTRLRHLTAFDGVVFAFNLTFHSDLWTAVALNSFHVSPLTLVAGTLCCVRDQNSTKQMQIIFCKIQKKVKCFL